MVWLPPGFAALSLRILCLRAIGALLCALCAFSLVPLLWGYPHPAPPGNQKPPFGWLRACFGLLGPRCPGPNSPPEGLQALGAAFPLLPARSLHVPSLSALAPFPLLLNAALALRALLARFLSAHFPSVCCSGAFSVLAVLPFNFRRVAVGLRCLRGPLTLCVCSSVALSSVVGCAHAPGSS